MKHWPLKRPPTTTLLVLLASVAGSWAASTPATAVDQMPKNGCTSPEPYSGALTSPAFDTGTAARLSFQGWFEAEGVNPSGRDTTSVQYSLPPAVPGDPRDWIEFGNMNQGAVGGGAPEQGESNKGLGQPPSFQSYFFDLPSPEATNQTGVQVRFRFDTGDAIYQGFRGVAVDGVIVNSGGGNVVSEDFEGGAPKWTFDAASGAGAPFWHVLNNPQTVQVKNPQINPTLVTLPDAGALPAASTGTHVAWFGDDATGTFCGPDYAKFFQLPPPPPPPGPRTLADLPNPQFAITVNVQAVKGDVLVGVPGAAAAGRGSVRASQKGIHFVPLREARQIPVGSYLNTRKGTVRLQSARDRRGTRQTGDFAAGLFQVLQSRRGKGLTDLVLKGSSFKGCPRTRRGKRASTALSRRSIRRRLRSSAGGRFRTRGRHSAATVRGTAWLTADRCDGTLTKVTRGRVAVRDFRRKRTIVVRAGRSYLARAPR